LVDEILLVVPTFRGVSDLLLLLLFLEFLFLFLKLVFLVSSQQILKTKTT